MATDSLAALKAEVHAGEVAVLMPLADGGTVRVIQHYRHLGSMVWPKCAMDREIAARATAGHVATIALGRSCLTKSMLPTGARGLATVSCCHSRCLYLCGTWPELARQQLARLGAAYYRSLRMVAGAQKPALNGAIPVSTAAVFFFSKSRSLSGRCMPAACVSR